MNAIDIFYFQYWLNIHAKEMFWRHLALLIHFDFERFIGLKNNKVKIPTFLDEEKLDFFKKNSKLLCKTTMLLF
jgi:hypothetical protein